MAAFVVTKCLTEGSTIANVPSAVTARANISSSSSASTKCNISLASEDLASCASWFVKMDKLRLQRQIESLNCCMFQSVLESKGGDTNAHRLYGRSIKNCAAAEQVCGIGQNCLSEYVVLEAI
jgi:hypothetical protein